LGTSDVEKMCDIPFDEPANVSLQAALAFKDTLYKAVGYDPTESARFNK